MPFTPQHRRSNPGSREGEAPPTAPPKEITTTDAIGAIDPTGVVRRFQYDDRGRLTRVLNGDDEILSETNYGNLDQLGRSSFLPFQSINRSICQGLFPRIPSSMIEQLPEVQRLNNEEKLQLATELWDQLTNFWDLTPDPEIVCLLKQRQADFKSGKQPSRPWSDIKAMIGK